MVAVVVAIVVAIVAVAIAVTLVVARAIAIPAAAIGIIKNGYPDSKRLYCRTPEK